MDEPPVAALKSPCCVCAAPGGKHCTKCKLRHYCSKACQLVDWNAGGHKAQCKQLAVGFQDRLLDSLMPAKLKIKEEPAIVEDVLLADGSKAAPRAPPIRATAPAVRTTADKATAVSDGTPDRRGTCGICLELLPVEADRRLFYECCCMKICTDCAKKCRLYDDRCPLCRAPPAKSEAEWLRRVQKHVDKGIAEAQSALGQVHHQGIMGLTKNLKRALQLYELAAAQGHPLAQTKLGKCYALGRGVKVNSKAAALWFQRAAEQGFPEAQFSLGLYFYEGQGVAQSYEEALKWYRLAAAQGEPSALYNLGVCHAKGDGVPQDFHEALRWFNRAAAQGYPGAAARVSKFEAYLAAARLT